MTDNITRESMINEIQTAFASVTRKNGVSWSESEVLDRYGDDEERRIARALDTETHWSQLINDPNWEVWPGLGGFGFLDAIGFRYYLPAAMIRAVLQGYDSGIQRHLNFVNEKFRNLHDERVRMLDPRQRACVARFLLYMASLEGPDYSSGPDSWSSILKTFWRPYLEPSGEDQQLCD